MRSNRSSIHKQKKSGNGYIQAKFGAMFNNLTINEQDTNSEKITTELKFNNKLEAISATSTPYDKKSPKQIGTLSESNTEKLSLSSPTQQNLHHSNQRVKNQHQLLGTTSPVHHQQQDNLNFYLNLSKKNDSKMKQIIEQSSRSRHTQFGSQNYK